MKKNLTPEFEIFVKDITRNPVCEVCWSKADRQITIKTSRWAKKQKIWLCDTCYERLAITLRLEEGE